MAKVGKNFTGFVGIDANGDENFNYNRYIQTISGSHSDVDTIRTQDIQRVLDFDDINGNMGADTASGGAGGDWVVGGKDNDLLYGDAGNDFLRGARGCDASSRCAIAGGSGHNGRAAFPWHDRAPDRHSAAR